MLCKKLGSVSDAVEKSGVFMEILDLAWWRVKLVHSGLKFSRPVVDWKETLPFLITRHGSDEELLWFAPVFWGEEWSGKGDFHQYTCVVDQLNGVNSSGIKLRPFVYWQKKSGALVTGKIRGDFVWWRRVQAVERIVSGSVWTVKRSQWTRANDLGEVSGFRAVWQLEDSEGCIATKNQGVILLVVAHGFGVTDGVLSCVGVEVLRQNKFFFSPLQLWYGTGATFHCQQSVLWTRTQYIEMIWWIYCGDRIVAEVVHPQFLTDVASLQNTLVFLGMCDEQTTSRVFGTLALQLFRERSSSWVEHSYDGLLGSLLLHSDPKFPVRFFAYCIKMKAVLRTQHFVEFQDLKNTEYFWHKLIVYEMREHTKQFKVMGATIINKSLPPISFADWPPFRSSINPSRSKDHWGPGSLASEPWNRARPESAAGSNRDLFRVLIGKPGTRAHASTSSRQSPLRSAISLILLCIWGSDTGWSWRQKVQDEVEAV